MVKRDVIVKALITKGTLGNSKGYRVTVGNLSGFSTSRDGAEKMAKSFKRSRRLEAPIVSITLNGKTRQRKLPKGFKFAKGKPSKKKKKSNRKRRRLRN